MRNGLEKWEKGVGETWFTGWGSGVGGKIYNSKSVLCNFFEKIFCQFKKRLYFCTRFRKRNHHKNKPHSSSGPGHLPLTQKIISSTLICGTKPPTREVFYLSFVEFK